VCYFQLNDATGPYAFYLIVLLVLETKLPLKRLYVMMNCKRIYFLKFLSQGMIVLINVNVILICLLVSVL
jgi:hypothetical protein